MFDTRSQSWSIEIATAIRRAIQDGHADLYCSMQPSEADQQNLVKQFGREGTTIAFYTKPNSWDSFGPRELWVKIG